MTPPVSLPNLTDDCSQCAALCCVAYPFDADEDFALLKRADTPCPNLSDNCLNCAIHDDLLPKGFGGCVAYQCAGAGQRVTQELFDGGFTAVQLKWAGCGAAALSQAGYDAQQLLKARFAANEVRA
ncbi:MAG: hypothetical protein VX228_11895, partial [Pseudomonadota bacterium]|nr:hypothetical protein [Pseudomonadota bacterium]